MAWYSLPRVNKCCGCVTDLRTATAIIAVLGIVTSPAVSWAVVRHAYVIRVSCFVTTSAARPDVVDVNLNHILSFGFGANAGLGPSCLAPKNRNATTERPITLILRNNELGTEGSSFVTSVRWIGWLVLIVDIIFLGFSIYLLYKIFRPPDKRAAMRFMISCIIAILFSFVYGMLYVAACLAVGGAFPIFEFVFCLIDVMSKFNIM
ncbi:uncharacterized protein LOC113496476 [Trichoplusia ni]|uniref:Uncharacterized protein LOC113496476 n=1 Tax=Trichoplusia ni TaxID=7111 RepID=A0A7E5VTC7_TRINI|nr:uncharacterized protein LOC113496476 [Trichoplusia ni]